MYIPEKATSKGEANLRLHFLGGFACWNDKNAQKDAKSNQE